MTKYEVFAGEKRISGHSRYDVAIKAAEKAAKTQPEEVTVRHISGAVMAHR